MAVIETWKLLQKVLQNWNVKFNPSTMKWAMFSDQAHLTHAINRIMPTNAPLYKTRVLFLEEGDKKSGLRHIYEGHHKEFEKKFGKSTEEEISNFMYNVLDNDKCEKEGVKLKDGKSGMMVVCKIPNKKDDYLKLVFGNNGYLITGYPTSKPKRVGVMYSP